MDTTDSSKAQAFLNTQAQHAGAHAATYRGVSYQLTGRRPGVRDGRATWP